MAIKARKVSIYLREEQLQWLDAKSKVEGVSRSKFIECKVFPEEMRVIEKRAGRPRKEKTE
jgi:hypothetical protein